MAGLEPEGEWNLSPQAHTASGPPGTGANAGPEPDRALEQSGIPALSPSPILARELREAIGREEGRVRRALQAFQATLETRERELAAREADVTRRADQLGRTLQSTRELGMRIQAEAQERAGEIEKEAQRAADVLAAQARDHFRELEEAMAQAERDIAQVRAAAEADATALVVAARAEAEGVVSSARGTADGMSERVTALLRLREGLVVSLTETLEQFGRALPRLADGGPATDGGPASDGDLAFADAPPPGIALPSDRDPDAGLEVHPDPTSQPAAPESGVRTKLVVAPVDTLAELKAIEEKLNAVPDVRWSSARRLVRGRAEIHVVTTEGVSLREALRGTPGLPHAVEGETVGKLSIRLER